MEINSLVCSQYLAALAMLGQAVERCPEDLWDAAQDRNRFWRVAYHAVFYTHLYLQKSLEDFRPWEKNRENVANLGAEIPPASGYTREEVLEYLGLCREEVKRNTAALDSAAPSGFHWLKFSKLELQFYNIRHLQQHTGELMERLGARASIDVDWVSRGE
jgi:hypothetical protein